MISARDPFHLDSATRDRNRSSGSDAKDHAFDLQTNDSPGKNKGDGQKIDYISMQQVGQHHLAHDAWVVVDGKVYE